MFPDFKRTGDASRETVTNTLESFLELLLKVLIPLKKVYLLLLASWNS